MTDLFSPHRDAVVRSLERRFGRELAEDAVQDALAAALAAGDRPANPKAWLHVVAHRRAVDALRGQREAPHAEPPEVGSAADPADEVVLRERVRSVLGALCTIPQRQRDALLLRSLEERSYAEIGARLEVEPENAKQLVSRGRRSLRQKLAGWLPAPVFARLAELGQRSFEVASGTAAGRACAGLCIAGAFATMSVEAPVVRELAVAPAATSEPTATATPTPHPRAARTPAPPPEPPAVATPKPRVVHARHARPTSTPMPRRAARTPTPTVVDTPTPTPWWKGCPRTQAALQQCEAQARQRDAEAGAKLKAERQAKIAARIPEITAASSEEDKAVWLRRKEASGQCPRTQAGLHACRAELAEKLR